MIVRLRIKELAEGRKLKQYELAAKSGVSIQLLNRYWNNHTQSVALQQFAMIAKALGVEPGELIEVIDDEETTNNLGLTGPINPKNTEEAERQS